MTTELQPQEQLPGAPERAAVGAPTLSPDDTWRPRPVRLRWLIGASAVTAVFLGISIWLGAFTPRLSVWETDGGYGVPSTERSFTVTNDAATPVKLVELQAPGGTVLTSAVLVRSDQSSRISRHHPLGDLVDDPYSLDAGASVNLIVTYRVVDCPTAMRDPGITLESRTFLGVSRSRTIGDDAMLRDTAEAPWCKATVP